MSEKNEMLNLGVLIGERLVADGFINDASEWFIVDMTFSDGMITVRTMWETDPFSPTPHERRVRERVPRYYFTLNHVSGIKEWSDDFIPLVEGIGKTSVFCSSEPVFKISQPPLVEAFVLGCKPAAFNESPFVTKTNPIIVEVLEIDGIAIQTKEAQSA